jgi:enoyl-CoA hydratase
MNREPEFSAVQEGSVLQITLTRRKSSNALSMTLVENLLRILKTAADDNTSLVIFKGEGKNFCSGFDLGDLQSQSDGDLLYKFVRIELLLQQIAHACFHTLAFAQGGVIGAGCDLFCACSERICSPNSTFRMPGWRFGIALGTRRLVQRVGPDSARLLLNESQTFTAHKAVCIGLANAMQPEDTWPQLISESKQRARSLEPYSRKLLLQLTTTDTREGDMASLVASASRPGLRERIVNFRAAELANNPRKR